MSRYDLVLTSEFPRAIETAVAMGFAAERQSTMLGSVMLAEREVDWMRGWEALAEAVGRGSASYFAAHCHAVLLRSVAAELPENGAALLVSHGGVVELGLVGLLPDNDFAGWGGLLDRCEGVRLLFDGVVCIRAEPLRLDKLVPAT